MNTCNPNHTPAYKIIYRGAKHSDYQPEWLVCEVCHEKKYFGYGVDIVSLEKIPIIV